MSYQYSIGQPVECVMFDGIWAVAKIIDCKFYTRYELRQGQQYEKDIPEVWLNPVCVRPRLTIVSDNARMMV